MAEATALILDSTVATLAAMTAICLELGCKRTCWKRLATTRMTPSGSRTLSQPADRLQMSCVPADCRCASGYAATGSWLKASDAIRSIETARVHHAPTIEVSLNGERDPRRA